MPRGGRRVGDPGKSYSNRTDLNEVHAPSPQMGADGTVSTASAGGAQAPPPQLAPQGPPPRSPDDTPMLSGPTLNPNEPVTAGLDGALGRTIKDQNLIDTNQYKTYLPALTQAARMQNMPPSFIKAVMALRNAPDA